MTSERIVARGPILQLRYAVNARLTLYSYDRTMAHRFADHWAAARACEDRCRTIPEDTEWIDRVLLGAYLVLPPTVEDEARIITDNINRRFERSHA